MGDESKTQVEAPTSVTEVAQSVQETVFGVWAAFVDHVPYLLVGVVVLILTWVVTAVLERSASRLLARWHRRESIRNLLTRLLVIGAWMLGLLLAAMVVFPGLTPAKALGGLGLLSVAVGFAFRDIFENFFAGLLILWRFPFENGDFVECQSITGRVESVSVRMTEIRKTTGELVVVPNAMLFKNPVEVLTNRSMRRTSLMTGVAYDVDVDEAVVIIEKAMKGCDTVKQDEPIQVYPNAFGSSSIDIELTWWTGNKPGDIRKSRAEVVSRIKRALDDAGIEIPFPYRTLTFKKPLPIVREGDASEAAA